MGEGDERWGWGNGGLKAGEELGGTTSVRSSSFRDVFGPGPVARAMANLFSSEPTRRETFRISHMATSRYAISGTSQVGCGSGLAGVDQARETTCMGWCKLVRNDPRRWIKLVRIPGSRSWEMTGIHEFRDTLVSGHPRHSCSLIRNEDECPCHPVQPTPGSVRSSSIPGLRPRAETARTGLSRRREGRDPSSGFSGASRR